MESESRLARQQLERLLSQRDALKFGAVRIEVPGAPPEVERDVNDYVVGCIALMRRFGEQLQLSVKDSEFLDMLDDPEHPEIDVTLPPEVVQTCIERNPEASIREMLAAYQGRKLSEALMSNEG